jgi:hypothetical protein
VGRVAGVLGAALPAEIGVVIALRGLAIRRRPSDA